MNPQQLSRFIKEKASALGFLSCGIAKVEFLEKEAKHLETWLKNDFHGKKRVAKIFLKADGLAYFAAHLFAGLV